MVNDCTIKKETMKKLNYKSEQDRTEIIEEQKKAGLFLIEDAIRKNEKFLIFDDKPLPDNSPSEEEVKIQKEIVLLQRENAIISLKSKGELPQEFTEIKEIKL